MRTPFRSSMFVRVFTTITTAIMLLFVAMYLAAVPFIEMSVSQIEERAARTALDNVFEMVEQIERDQESQRLSILVTRKTGLRDIIAVVESRANWLEQQVRSGKLSSPQAKRMLLDEIREIHYGNNDYVWASDYHSVLLAHPDPKLNGADFSAKEDIRGKLIVPPMVAIARASGDGYYSYWWRRLGQDVPVEKLSYARHIPFFELILGTGVYIDDIDLVLANRRTMALDNLRYRLKTLRIAKTGYMYIFDGSMQMLVHPNPNIENTNFANILEPGSGKPLGPILMAATGQAEGVRYMWDHPADPGHYVYEKMSWVRHVEASDWYIGSSVYVNELKESAQTLKNRLLTAYVATLLVSIILTYLFVSWLVTPLKQLGLTAQRVEAGDLDARCNLQRNDEIGVVAKAFNGMVKRLQDNIQNLDARIEVRTADLEKANAELMKLDQLKSDFLSTVSHELRTPMTSVVGFAKRVKKKLEEVIFPNVAANDKTTRAMAQISGNIDIIVKESERLTLLINDVLDSAKLDAGKVEWQFVPLAPTRMLEQASAVVAALAEQKGLSLTWRTEPDIPAVRGDEARLQQVLINLISNAIKFSSQGGVVVDAARQDDNVVVFSICDTGIGIAPEHVGTVFDKFKQVGDTLTDKPQGTGLGLSICRQIIEGHGGRIWVESTLGQGSTFRFTIPAEVTGTHPAQ